VSEQSDDALDALLREQFEGRIPADDFCDRFMERLPPRRRFATLPLAVGISAGAAMCWLSLRSERLLNIGWHDYLSGDLSAPAVTLLTTITGISLLALAWIMLEAERPPHPPSTFRLRSHSAG
jgi:hypothetical protein